MAEDNPQSVRAEHVVTARDALAAALAGDFDALSRVLTDDVRWHGAGSDPGSGCTSREEALVWLGETVARGISAEVLDVRALDEDRVLVLLQRNPRGDSDEGVETPSPHGQILTFRDGKVSEIVVYGTDEAAIEAAGSI